MCSFFSRVAYGIVIFPFRLWDCDFPQFADGIGFRRDAQAGVCARPPKLVRAMASAIGFSVKDKTKRSS